MQVGQFDYQLLKPKFWLAWLALGLLYLFSCLPVKWRWRIMGYVGKKSLYGNQRRLNSVHANINLCFPEWSVAQKQQLLAQYWQSAGFGVGEMAWLWFRSKKAIKARTVIEGKAHLSAAQKTGRTIIFLVPHMMFLEYAAYALAYHLKVGAIFNTFKHPLIDWLVARKRRQFSDMPIRRQSGNTLQQLIDASGDGWNIYHLADEDLGIERSVFAPLFGTPKATLANLGKLIGATNGLIVPCHAQYRHSDDKIVVHLAAPLDLTPICADAVATATAVNQAYERMIRANPGEFMWNLHYFRTRPEGDARRMYDSFVDFETDMSRIGIAPEKTNS